MQPPRPNCSGAARIHPIAPLEYADFVHLLSRAWLIASDSGGIQEEAPTLGKPVLILRDTTERPEVLECGIGRLVGHDAARFRTMLEEAYADDAWAQAARTIRNPFGNGDAGERIAAAVQSFLNPGAGDARDAGVRSRRGGRMKVTVMMPAYNEERDLPGLLERTKAALEGWADYQVLIVDDGSKDRTATIVREAANRMPVTLIQHPQNRGLGAAMRTGLKAASDYDGVVVTMDADNSQGPELIQDMVARIGTGADVVIASRFQPGSQEVGVPAHRRFLSHLSSAGIRVLIRYPGARDYTCGFRVYRAEVLRRLISRYGDNFIRENGFSCMLELLLNLRRINAKVAEVPLVLRYDLKEGASKMRILRTMWRYVVTVTRGWLPLATVTLAPHAAAPLAASRSRRPTPAPARTDGLPRKDGASPTTMSKHSGNPNGV